jgi:hypothetical protein
MSLIINTLLNFDLYRVGIVNGSRTIKLPVVSDANRNKGNNKITELRFAEKIISDGFSYNENV